MRCFLKIILLICFAILGSRSFAHENIDHSKEVVLKKTFKENSKNERYIKINTEYIERIKPIFVKSCFDCHGSITEYPWYYQIPGVKQYINSDIKEAKKHLDLSTDFPFKGHGTTIEDLRAIGKNINEGSMPPRRYLIMHKNTNLTKQELEQVNKWIAEASEILND